MVVIDPVCGMSVNEKTAQWKYEYKGKTYYFCALGCMYQFKKNPEKYLNVSDGIEHKHSHQHHKCC